MKFPRNHPIGMMSRAEAVRSLGHAPDERLVMSTPMLEEGSAALVVIGIDGDADRIEQAAKRSKRHALKRSFGDFDEAEQEALAAMEQSVQAG